MAVMKKVEPPEVGELQVQVGRYYAVLYEAYPDIYEAFNIYSAYVILLNYLESPKALPSNSAW